MSEKSIYLLFPYYTIISIDIFVEEMLKNACFPCVFLGICRCCFNSDSMLAYSTITKRQQFPWGGHSLFHMTILEVMLYLSR